MKIESFELRRVAMPLVAPFRTSFGVEVSRDILLVKVTTDIGVTGWGECVSGADPLYSSEYVDASIDVMTRFLIPRLFAAGEVSAEQVAEVLAAVKGHRMSKAALEMAILDAELRSQDRSLTEHFGGMRSHVLSGVSVGIMDSIPELVDAVDGYLSEGYVRIKLKIEPGWDVEPVRTMRERFGDDLLLQVDANAAYTLGDASHLAKLDDFDLLLIEQPLANDDLRHHSLLAQRVRTPICLDESIESAKDAADAIALGAAQIINIKAGRVGGYLEARRIHDLCRAHGVPVWCGGMLETGLGRAANVALAALPGFTLPGDTSGSSRYYKQDITDPFVLREGGLDVPSTPGIGREPDERLLSDLSVWVGAVERS